MTAADTPGSQRGQSSADLDGGPLSWDAMASAIGLLTRLELCRDVPRTAVLGDQRPDEVLAALEVLTTALLEVLYPRDQGAAALHALGLLAAEKAAGDLPEGQQ